jgi:hypothetical protein
MVTEDKDASVPLICTEELSPLFRRIATPGILFIASPTPLSGNFSISSRDKTDVTVQKPKIKI